MLFRSALLAVSLALLGAAPAVAAPGPVRGQPAVAGAAMSPGAMNGKWKPYDYGEAQSRREEIPSGTLVVVAYIVLWGVLLGYVVLLAMRQRRLMADLRDLRRELERRQDGEPDPPADPPAGAAPR